jgi:hypothetical protein
MFAGSVFSAFFDPNGFHPKMSTACAIGAAQRIAVKVRAGMIANFRI